MISLVTDRTAEDVNRLRELTQKALTGSEETFAERLSEEEREEWISLNNKGAYNASDLNRVAVACAEIYSALAEAGYEVPAYYPTPSDFETEDVPHKTMMGWYIGNIAAIKNVFDAETDIPTTMDGLDYYGANAIERLLLEVDSLLQRVKLNFLYSGEVCSGEF